jgi:tetratricopeptide (TPR) repeat protein
VSDQPDPSTLRAENIQAAAQPGGVAVGAVQVDGDVSELHIGPKYVSEALTLRATPPAPPPHFTGRDDDLVRFTQLLTSGQNVAITALQGMGGIGKTALAQKLAERVRDQFPGGVLWWTLGPSADVFSALDVWARHADPRADLTSLPRAEDRAEAVRPLLARLGKLCVIVDDVWDEAAARILMSAIPPGCPILITTRDGDLAKSLRCRVERIDALSDDEAVALLEKLLGPLETNSHPERNGGRMLSGTQWSRSTPAMQSKDAYSAACDIAQLTEGLPLALELIAGLADSPADLPILANELRTRPTLDVLKRGKTREQSIEVCFTMSYERLDAEMQRRFRALGVFAPAPFDRDAIAAVWDEDGDVARVDEAIKFLARRSLLARVSLSQGDAAQSRREAEATPGGPPALRAEQGQHLVVAGDTLEEYHQHALLRDYAATLARGSAASDIPPDHPSQGSSAAARHAAYYRRFAKEKDWRTVEHYFDQIDHGWQWVQAKAPDQIISYVFAAQDFLTNRGRQSERLKWLNAGVAQARASKDRRQEGTLLNNIGYLYSALGQKDKALDFFQQALAIRREVGYRSGEGATLNNIGEVYRTLGQTDKALDFFRQALAIWREVGDRSGEGSTLNNIGGVYRALGQMNKALDFYQQALAIWREVGDRSGEGTTLNNIGAVYDALGQNDQALDFFQQALAIHREVGNRSMEGTTLNNVGEVYRALGQTDQALDFFQQALAIRREVGDRSGEGATLSNIGAVYDALGQKDKALDFFRQALAIHREVGNRSMEGSTLNNIGGVYRALGQTDQALDFFQQALAICREVGDRFGESVTLFNIGLLLDEMGRTAEAVTYLEQNVALDEAIGHPDLESDRATLERVRGKLGKTGNR